MSSHILFSKYLQSIDIVRNVEDTERIQSLWVIKYYLINRRTITTLSIFLSGVYAECLVSAIS